MSRVVAGALAVAFAASGTGCDQATAPTQSTFSVVPVVETFTGTLQPSGEAYYAFTMSLAGTVVFTLTSMVGPDVPSDALFPVGLGTPAGTGCTASVDGTVRVGAVPGFRIDKPRGVYCVRLADNARLGAPAVFTLLIQHPR